ncbi:MAG: AbrB/MazE/SpoVT family DNA-binding domain-containing protein [Thermoprotei archaeon]|nr:MAG: AbrB/MazE/SpoVT family DNA-binding domain-containing protein [Thermoprotei archaeon]
MIVLKVRKKGILIIPKHIRERVGIEEDSEVIVEVKDSSLIIRPLKPKVVRIDPNVIEELLREEYILEGRKYEGIVRNLKTST